MEDEAADPKKGRREPAVGRILQAESLLPWKDASWTSRSIFFRQLCSLWINKAADTWSLNHCCPKVPAKDSQILKIIGLKEFRADGGLPEQGTQALFLQVPSGLSRSASSDIPGWICQLKPCHLPGSQLSGPQGYQDITHSLSSKIGSGEGHKEREQEQTLESNRPESLS